VRVVRYCFFLGLVCLVLASITKRVEGQALTEDVVKDVKILFPEGRDATRSVLSEARHVLPGTSPAPIGKTIWAFYGCVSCHDFSLESFNLHRGPDLDHIGAKTTAAWLARWLTNPSSVQPHTPMPRVPLSATERRSVMAFLLAQKDKVQLPTVQGGDPQRGKDLFKTFACLSCHRLGDKGMDIGPALDGVQTKIRRAWLVAYLMNPEAILANTRMPNYGFSQAQAEDLASFLLENTTVDQEVPTDVQDTETRVGLSIFVQRGCAGCHHIKTYRRPIALPEIPDRAFVDHHAVVRQESPWIDLTASQIDAMVGIFIAPPSRYVAPDSFLTAFWQTPIPAQGRAPAAYDSAALSLHPEACGECHVRQLEDWQTTIHSKSMGPGVLGQFVDEAERNPQFVENCQLCHAPASEQHPALSNGGDEYASNPDYDANLHQKGMPCQSACALWSAAWFSPFRTDLARPRPWGRRPCAGF
jgi:cytochrome c551/c552